MVHFAKFLKGNVFADAYVAHESTVWTVQNLLEFCDNILYFRMIGSHTITYKTCPIKLMSAFSLSPVRSVTNRKAQEVFR